MNNRCRGVFWTLLIIMFQGPPPSALCTLVAVALKRALLPPIPADIATETEGRGAAITRQGLQSLCETLSAARGRSKGSLRLNTRAIPAAFRAQGDSDTFSLDVVPLVLHQMDIVFSHDDWLATRARVLGQPAAAAAISSSSRTEVEFGVSQQQQPQPAAASAASQQISIPNTPARHYSDFSHPELVAAVLEKDETIMNLRLSLGAARQKFKRLQHQKQKATATFKRRLSDASGALNKHIIKRGLAASLNASVVEGIAFIAPGANTYDVWTACV